MILVNAIYFKGSWKSNFPSEDTFIGNFETASGPKKIEYMKQTSDFFYAKPPEIGAQILRLPYEVIFKFRLFVKSIYRVLKKSLFR